VYEQSLTITREIGDRAGEAQTLNNIGVVYESLGKYPEAIAQYEASLAITREIGDRAGEAKTLGNMGLLFEAQNDPVLAIIFLKQAINIYEAIRDSNQALAQEFQDSYTATIEDDYRTLADLLLQQNRILEAQRVLDLLRVQELDDYLRGVQRNATTEAGVAYWQVETKLLQLYRELLLAGNDLALLRDIPFSELNPEQSDRLEALTAREGELEENFQQWLEHPEVAATLAALRTSTEGNNLEIEDYATLQQNLANLPQNTVLLYPLILDQRLELVLVSPHAPPVRHPVDVEAAELNRVITAFGQSLKYARPDIEIHAQQLYDWLIKPLEDNLSDAQAEMIIFAPDGVLRYVPLAALHDGDGWLAERFSFTHITAAALTNFAAKPQDNPRLLAAACGECDFEYEVAGQQFRFSLLPYAESEVVRLSEQMPNVDVLPTADFTPEALNLRLGSYEILHLATHGAFVSGQPEESFIVFGDESRLNLTQIEQQWKLPNADLVVLSACETAVGSDELGTGVEILGLGYQIQQAGAKATLASLWPVSDGGTQVLMTAFYSALAAGKTKAEALQLAQLALITGNSDAVGLPRGGFVLDDIPDEVVSGLAHPHYWAPFILIGNGL
jgi:CHAT domain-containing protein